LAQAAPYIGAAVKSLADQRWRRKHGLVCIRIGRKLVFDVATLDIWLRARTERLPRPAGPGEGEGEAR
jgi:hypothetical protein